MRPITFRRIFKWLAITWMIITIIQLTGCAYFKDQTSFCYPGKTKINHGPKRVSY